MTLEEKASTFRRLHEGPETLVLPNAWDVVSARMFEAAGFPAIGTTSAGLWVTRDIRRERMFRVWGYRRGTSPDGPGPHK